MPASWAGRRVTRLLGLCLCLVVVATAPAAAISWRAARPIHPSAQPMTLDADLRAADTAIIWLDEAGPDAGLLGMAAFRGSGTGEIFRYTVEDGIDRAAVAVCDGDVWMAWFRPLGDAGGELELARISIGGNGIERVTMRSGARVGAIDTDCGGGRVWVAWTERTTSWHAFSRSVRIADLVTTTVRDLGAASRASISVAATGGQAVVAWTAAGGGLRMKRYSVGAAPALAVTGLATRSLVPGGRTPVVAMDGRRVALGYTRAQDAWMRTSTDGGATFSGPRKLAENGFEEGGGETSAWFVSVAVEGRRIVASVAVQWPPVPVYHRARSTNGGASWSVEPLDIHVRLAGLLTTPGGPRAGEVKMRTGYWDEPMDWRITFRRER